MLSKAQHRIRLGARFTLAVNAAFLFLDAGSSVHVFALVICVTELPNSHLYVELASSVHVSAAEARAVRCTASTDCHYCHTVIETAHKGFMLKVEMV